MTHRMSEPLPEPMGVPLLPSATSSGLPPTRVATTGFPAAMDSRITLDMPSLVEQSTDTSRTERMAGVSFLAPRK